MNSMVFESSGQKTGQSHSSHSNRQEEWTKRHKSTNRQKKWKNKQHSLQTNLYCNNNENIDKCQNKINEKFNFGFKRLEELCNKDASEIIFIMSNKRNGFMDLFTQNKDPDWIFLLMKITAKICSTEFIQSKTFLLNELTCNAFFEHLKKYILSTPSEKNLDRCNKMNLFFNDCLVVYQSISTVFSKKVIHRLKEIVVSSNIALTGIKNYNKNIKISESTMVHMQELLKNLNDIKITDEVNMKEKLVFDNIAQCLSPPENFRELTVYPTAIDLQSGKPFLRPNISKGAYQNVEHYLDVQFRLLREDFIGPLREAIMYYKEMINEQQQRRKKINNIRIYCDVEFEKNGVFIQDKSGFLINFNKNNKSKINWEMAKRFMYGSLLLFTVNEFKTFFIGIVLEREIELLKQGKLIVELLEDATPIYNTSLTMVESEVFFEPYKCSMEVLKNISSHNFPMEKYIISASNIINYPCYIDTLPDQYYYIDNLKKFHLFSNEEWPTKEKLGLDKMQYRAFRAALTCEFTVIQGPPGTGKTFIGLKIMKSLIQNLYENIRSDVPPLKKPILVVCFTNHALDQFMEGILNFTDKVVRIGGQSKSEIIQKYSLQNVTRVFRRSFNTNKTLGNISEKVKNIMSEIQYFRQCNEVVSYNAGVLELSLLKNGMPEKFHNFFQNTLDLLSWLFQDFNYFVIDPIGFIEATSNELINKVFHSDKLLEIKSPTEEDDNMHYEAEDPNLKYDHRDIVIYCITLDDIKSACKELLLISQKFEEQEDLDMNSYNEFEEIKFNFSIMEKIHDYFTFMLSLSDTDIDFPKSIDDLTTLDMNQRWALYFQWVKATKDMFVPKIMLYEQKYSQMYKQYAELKELENIEVLNNMHVVALTTTGAAKHRVMLEGLESQIVVVEEAAEVLEAHIITSLTRHCQHLILIGDHKQLRPSNAVYNLAKEFNFDISLFERMVNNDVPCYTLAEQHRMRPEIASLITPAIYHELKNHVSVYNRKHIIGVTKDLFFLNHNIYEKEVDEISSKSNEHEATFLIMFARHLILQGYKTDQVTILTAYQGQSFLLRSLQKKHPKLYGMRITVVDNYQGEESDIILLSLVRSNENGNVGFLKTENRICVALSRAKYGLYIMGNMEILYNSCNLWKQIKESLVNQESYGDELTLECAIHQGINTKVSKVNDFKLIMEGGCTMLCKSLLSCGHFCTRLCHSYDRDHLELKCREPCDKSCDYNHPCLKSCSMDCGKCNVPVLKKLPCGHQLTLPCYVNFVVPCEEKVEIVLKECGHTIIKKCHEEPKCTFQCFDRLDCGHVCERTCHKNNDPNHRKYKCLVLCEYINQTCPFNHKCQKLCHENDSSCKVKINKTLSCGHTKYSVPCGLSKDEIICYFPCERLLTCSHKCRAKCHETCKPCEKEIKKIIPECGHSITIKCKLIPKHKNCTQMCDRTLDCGHKCKNLCAIKCTTKKCKEIILKKISTLACGHNKVWVLCCDKNKEFRLDSQYLLDKCREPCLQLLNCNDICPGTCGQCKQGRLHVPCGEICNKINPCSHTCKSPCKDRCPPCNQKCIYSCVHFKCTKTCGNPCVKCKKQCNWRCLHLNCTKKCYEICDRKPCYEPCEIKLQCGHECIGFCGEPCPPLCRICQYNEVTSVVFGNEDKPNARFVYLNDCKHSVESEALEQWMNQNVEKIAFKQCPLCKTPILKTQRFMNQVKVMLEDIQKIKQLKLSVHRSNKNKIHISLKTLDTTFHSELIDSVNKLDHIKDLWDTFSKPILDLMNEDNVGANLLSLRDIESLDVVIDLFKSISKFKKQIENFFSKKKQMGETVVDHFVWLLTVAIKYDRQLSDQQKIDINMEMARGIRIISFYEVISSDVYMKFPNHKMQKSSVKEVKYSVSKIETLLMSCKRYCLTTDKKIQKYTNFILQKVKGVVITTDEERMNYEAVHFISKVNKQCHWCKCPNGHISCVTERERPMQDSVCPVCKVTYR